MSEVETEVVQVPMTRHAAAMFIGALDWAADQAIQADRDKDSEWLEWGARWVAHQVSEQTGETVA